MNDKIEEFGPNSKYIFRALKEEYKRTINIKDKVKSYKELDEMIKITKKILKDYEIKDINFEIEINFYISEKKKRARN